MPDIPIERVASLAEEFGHRQIIVLAWDGKLANIVTWGDSIDYSDMAAEGGNRLKDCLGWPKKLRAESPRVTKLRADLALQTALADAYRDALAEALTGIWKEWSTYSDTCIAEKVQSEIDEIRTRVEESLNT